MLVLTRKRDEVVVIEANGVIIRIAPIDIRGDKVRIGFEAPFDVRIHREEIYEAILRERAAALEPQ